MYYTVLVVLIKGKYICVGCNKYCPVNIQPGGIWPDGECSRKENEDVIQ